MCGDRKVRKLHSMVVASVFTLALVALPAAPSLDGVSLDGKAAYAKGGKGGGNAGGRGGKGGKGGKGGASLGVLTGSHDKGHTGTGLGHGKSLGSSAPSTSGHGVTSTTMGELKGNLNAYHASVSAFQHAADTSMVGRIRAAITENLSGTEAEISLAQKAALEALSNQPVNPEVLNEVHGIVSGKVAEAEALGEAETESSD